MDYEAAHDPWAWGTLDDSVNTSVKNVVKYVASTLSDIVHSTETDSNWHEVYFPGPDNISGEILAELFSWPLNSQMRELLEEVECLVDDGIRPSIFWSLLTDEDIEADGGWEEYFDPDEYNAYIKATEYLRANFGKRLTITTPAEWIVHPILVLGYDAESGIYGGVIAIETTT